MCREYAIQKFERAQESENYVCGMQPLDADDHIYGVIVTLDGRECYRPIEFDYYLAKVMAAWFKANSCAYYAGSSGTEGFVDWHCLIVSGKVCYLFAQRVELMARALPIAHRKRRNIDTIQRSD